MPGAGKSTLSKKISAALNWDNIDLDAVIESGEKKSINQIFSDHNEAYFRQLEADYLHRIVSETDNTVISLGGGTPCFNGNMDFILKHGFVIYLKVKPGILASRIIKSDQRPAFVNLSQEQIENKLNALLEIREPYFLRSHLVLENSAKIKEDALKAIRHHFQL